ncbi:hypothetical protein PR048_031684 [Dryococelus australis]|uniref:Uncharacterized protein n=1 Tax=Dryococelus australis TaxID=614101 RepID=A0ABQ9G5Z5_9NEOP|nr:hypothetical protein PR048_031684 [Dryococelus australis]
MELRRNERAGETGDPRQNPPTNGIVRHESHVRKSGDLTVRWHSAKVGSRVCPCSPDMFVWRMEAKTLASGPDLPPNFPLSALGSPLVDDQPIMNAVKYREVSGVERTYRTTVSSNTDINRIGVLAVVCKDDSLLLYHNGAELKGRGKREIPEKTRRPTASSGTIPTSEKPVTRPGIEPEYTRNKMLRG